MNNFFYSTKINRDTNRINGIINVFNDTVSSYSYNAIIPGKIIQSLNSTRSVIISDTNYFEKIMHFMQILVAITQLGLGITILLRSESCSNNNKEICKAISLCNLIYKGLLLTGWVPGELYKQPYNDNHNQQKSPGDTNKEIKPVDPVISNSGLNSNIVIDSEEHKPLAHFP